MDFTEIFYVLLQAMLGAEEHRARGNIIAFCFGGQQLTAAQNEKRREERQ
jgi:hypothetical protein